MINDALIAVVDFVLMLLMPLAAMLGLSGELDDVRAVARGQEIHYVVSNNMWPTLPEGAHARAEVLDRPERGARLGTVVTFTVEDSVLIARVAGLPGDTIQIIGGRLHRDGSPVPRKAAPPRLEPDFLSRLGDDGELAVPRKVACYQEILGAAPHEICETEGDNGFADNTEPFVVPAGHIFFLGDNRDNSNDSRSDTGFVPFADIIGIVRTVRTGSTVFEVDRHPPADGTT